MILPRYQLAASTIVGAGQGWFAAEHISKGRVIIAPDKVHTVWPEAKLRTFAPESIENQSSVRWFETQFSLTPEWSDECYVNHSFTPNALWHLGFIFALRDIAVGEELLMDYRHVIGSGELMPFKDSATGREIVGLPWPQVLQESAAVLAQLF